MKDTVIWIITALVIVGGLIGVVLVAKQNIPTVPEGTLSTPPSDSDRVRGEGSAKITLVEYSDFQCPACASFYPHVEEISKELGVDMRFVYRHFTLPQHKNAETAAYSAEAAGMQGKFFEMYSKMFENQNDWAEKENASQIFEIYAKELGLDINKYVSDVKSEAVKGKVEADIRSALSSKVNSTPTFFLNGERMKDYKTFDEFKNTIREKLRSAS